MSNSIVANQQIKETETLAVCHNEFSDYREDRTPSEAPELCLCNLVFTLAKAEGHCRPSKGRICACHGQPLRHESSSLQTGVGSLASESTSQMRIKPDDGYERLDLS